MEVSSFLFRRIWFGDQLFAEESGESRDPIRRVISSCLREESIFIGVDIWSDQHLVSGRRNHISIERSSFLILSSIGKELALGKGANADGISLNGQVTKEKPRPVKDAQCRTRHLDH